MEKLTKSRGPLRTAFTKAHKDLMAELSQETPDNKKLKLNLAKLEDKVTKLAVIDEKILAALMDDADKSEEDYNKEAESIEEYSDKFIECRVLVSEILNASFNPFILQNQNTHFEEANVTKQKFRLPKMEIPKFDGELKNWLCFWSLFKKVHEDNSIDSEDKFQLLLQVIVPGTRAYEMLTSYPPTAENYPKVIDCLKKRFGRDDLLVEVYVRELLGLVLQNALNPKEKVCISKLFDKIECHMRALDSLGVTSEKCAAMIYPLVESSLPEDVLRAWQRSSTPPTEEGKESKNRLTLLMDFLRSEVEGEERIKLSRTGFGLSSGTAAKQSKKREIQEDIPTAASLFSGEAQPSSKNIICIFCDKKHSSQQCFKAQKMTFSQKKLALKKKKGCFVCLKSGHFGNDCKSNVQCLVCAKKHSPLMCPDLPQNKEEAKKEEKKEDASTSHSMTNLSCSAEVGLQTLIVRVGENTDCMVRAIFDSASQRSYILKKTVDSARINHIGEERIIHTLFGGVQSQQKTHRRYEVLLTNLTNTFHCAFEFLDQDRICHDIPRMKTGPWSDELRSRGIHLTDVGDGCPEIEVLIGADIMGKLLTGVVHQLNSGLTAIETKLGWTLLGRLPGRSTTSNSCLLVTTLLTAETNISDFWKLETIGITDSGESKSRADMEAAAKRHFLETVTVNSSGRYEVHLPWVEGHPPLPTNRPIAEKRLITTSNKLQQDGRMDVYQAVFDGWLEEGIIENVSEEELGENVHFLPHRAVFKENSLTTKVRPVFDASAKFKTHPSLNDCLEKGPNLIEQIPSTVMRFRMNRIGVVSDIRKAFLQVAVSEKDCNYLLFLWWSDYKEKTIKVFRHRRVVFGATSSPFLLAAVLEYHLSQVTPHLKVTAEKLLKSFYVDNCVTSVDNELELSQFIRDSTAILACAKFDLLGWEHTGLTQNSKTETPLLGMVWDKKEDTLYCDLKGINSLLIAPVTKRKILSVAHKVFDIIGFSAPVTIAPKILLQKTWKLKVGWDAELGEDLSDAFLRWSKDILLLEKIKIPRWFGGSEREKQDWTLHIFSDASGLAYAACVYLRIKSSSRVIVQLVQAKSRVAPLDKLTIPRLELLSCLIGCRLSQMVKSSMGLKDVRTYYWTDSSTALHWIQNDELWNTFVGNRVKEIRTLTNAQDWRHVPGTLNPADLPSRGCSVKQLIESKWWEGPEWLKKDAQEWPYSSVNGNLEDINRERKKTVTSLLVGTLGTQILLKRFSSYSRCLRVVGWILRFICHYQKTQIKSTGELKVSELELAEKSLLRMVQREAFTSEKDDKLKTLSVFMDSDGLLKVNTKIMMRNDSSNFKCPILLPSDHPVVHLLIRDEHLKSSHAGAQLLMCSLRENYWIIRGRKTIRAVLGKCMRCRRYEVKGLTCVPVSLPEDRVRDAEVFEITGVDLAGPLWLQGNQKVWIVLFTCAVFRAIHLELVTSISTDNFLQSFRRFVARRGRPAIMYSDNGTNFVGADNLFKKIDWKEVEAYSSSRKIQWKFNPPTGAWWGGWWERLVGLIKKLLRRVLGKASLSFESLYTVLCDCEAVINARPLTYISEDGSDLAPLTPSAFLQERRETGVPDIDDIDNASLNRAFRRRQHLMNQLRQRFRLEYLGQLIQRAQSTKDCRPVQIGDVVLVGSDNIKRLDWPLAKIINIYPGKDNNVRVVQLKTATGELVRPIQRIYPLEVSSQDDPVLNIKEVNIPAVHPVVETGDEASVKVLRTRSGREIRIPTKFSASFSSFIL